MVSVTQSNVIGVFAMFMKSLRPRNRFVDGHFVDDARRRFSQEVATFFGGVAICEQADESLAVLGNANGDGVRIVRMHKSVVCHLANDQGNAAAALCLRQRKTRCPPLALTDLFCGGEW